jgi:hypothetical protein
MPGTIPPVPARLDARRLDAGRRGSAGRSPADSLTDFKQTAELAFGPAGRSLLSTPRPAGANTVIVGHAYPVYTLIGGQYLEEGEAAFVQPRGAGFEVVARAGLKEWRQMGQLPPTRE